MDDLDGWDAEKIGALLFHFPLCMFADASFYARLSCTLLDRIHACSPTDIPSLLPIISNHFRTMRPKSRTKPRLKRRVQNNKQQRNLPGRGTKLHLPHPHVILSHPSPVPPVFTLQQSEREKKRGRLASLSLMKVVGHTGSRSQARDGNAQVQDLHCDFLETHTV